MTNFVCKNKQFDLDLFINSYFRSWWKNSKMKNLFSLNHITKTDVIHIFCYEEAKVTKRTSCLFCYFLKEKIGKKRKCTFLRESFNILFLQCLP